MKQLGILLTPLAFLLLPTTSFAASLYFDPGDITLHSGDSVVMSIRINTDPGECVNVVDAVINYDPVIQPVDFSRGQSIFPIWVEEPTVDKVNNRITFAAGIPNGYCGRVEGDPKLTNEVLKIVFQVPGLRVGSTPESPTTTVEFTDETHIYLNDGSGSMAPLFTVPAEVAVINTPGDTVKNDWAKLVRGDVENPQQFSINLVKDESVFDDKYYIVFNTTDKQTGIAYYEVMEETLAQANSFTWGRVDAPWVSAKSPYVLKDQSLNSTIRVKAVDKAGNEYIAVLVPDESLRSISLNTFVFYGMIASLIVLVLVLVVVILLRLRRRHTYVSREDSLSEDDLESTNSLINDEHDDNK